MQIASASRPTDRPSHVLFFAAVPPQGIIDQIAEAWRLTGTGGSLRRNTLHVTILAITGLNTLYPTLIDHARRAATTLRAVPFELCFDRLMTFGGGMGKRPLVLRTDSQTDRVTALATELHNSLTETGLVLPRLRKVTPHVTVAYGAGFTETRPLPAPIRWTIRDITLIDSLQGQGRHVSLGTWPLSEGGRRQPFED